MTEKQKKAGLDLAIQRLETQGISIVSTSDGKVMLMSAGWLRQMLDIAEKSPTQSVCALLDTQDPSAPEFNQ